MDQQEALRQEALRQLYENPCTESLQACYEAFQDRLIRLYQTVEQHIISVQEEEGRHRLLGVVLDIDETVLFNDPDCVHRNPYMGPFLDLFQRLGVLVYFVTGRLSQHRDTTLRQLESLDFLSEGVTLRSSSASPRSCMGCTRRRMWCQRKGWGASACSRGT